MHPCFSSICLLAGESDQSGTTVLVLFYIILFIVAMHCRPFGEIRIFAFKYICYRSAPLEGSVLYVLFLDLKNIIGNKMPILSDN